MRAMLLLCDEMLMRLGRWLRAAGHDTAIAPPGSDDGALLRQAAREDRLLLTRDAHLARHAGRSARVLLLQGNDLEAQARELRQGLALDWQAAPFSRCIVDNSVLRPASQAETAAAPPAAQALNGPFRRCPACSRLYWPGSHHRRMQVRLRHWNAAPAG